MYLLEKEKKLWTNVRIINIKWDTPDEINVMPGLPDKVSVLDLNINFSQYDPNEDLDYNEDFLYEVSENLTKKYGFCHDGFDIEVRRK